MPAERLVGGLRCGEVLAVLSQYVDGDLAQAVRQQVETHVAGCGECARFGREFAAMVAAVGRNLAAPAVEPSVEKVTAATLAALPRK